MWLDQCISARELPITVTEQPPSMIEQMRLIKNIVPVPPTCFLLPVLALIHYLNNSSNFEYFAYSTSFKTGLLGSQYVRHVSLYVFLFAESQGNEFRANQPASKAGIDLSTSVALCNVKANGWSNNKE